MSKRSATITRETTETKISLKLSLDGTGRFDVRTGSTMFDHLLSQMAQHGLFDIMICASGSDHHHVVEDVAISLGRAFSQALGDKKGITRMGHALVPMDEALALVAVDIGGRGYALVETPFKRKKVGDLESDMMRHFLESFAIEAKISLHAGIITGVNDHHKAEALFKALGRALDDATRIDKRRATIVPSTKGVVE